MRLKMIVEPDYHKNIDPLGDWDGTWDESYCYVIYDSKDGQDVVTKFGFRTEEQAREAGEKALKRLEERE